VQWFYLPYGHDECYIVLTPLKIEIVITLYHIKTIPRIRGTEDSASGDSQELDSDLYKAATSLLTLVRSSSARSPHAYALFMDELASVLAQGKLLPQVEVILLNCRTIACYQTTSWLGLTTSWFNSYASKLQPQCTQLICKLFWFLYKH